jgi:hypothetical protein
VKPKLRIGIRREHPFRDEDDISVFLWHRSDHTTAVAQSIAFRTLTPGEMGVEQEPALRIDRDAAQQLMDELWHVGLRPTEGSGSAGSLAATERHLADMRHLVFKTTPKT